MQSDTSSLPSWLNFDSNSNRMHGMPTSSDVGSLNLMISATDPDGLTTDDYYFTMEVLSNYSPTVRSGESMLDQYIKSNLNFSFQIPDKLFQDTDGESVVLHVQLGNGSEVPSWLKFTPENRLVFGKATNDYELLSLKIVATDKKRASAEDFFILYISENKAPLVIQEIPSLEVFKDIYFQYQIPSNTFRDDDNDALSYSIGSFDNDNPIPVWLTFVPSNRTLLGVPKDGNYQSIVKIVVDDGRDGVVYQIAYINAQQNYDIAKIGALVVVGLGPLFGMLCFIFAMAFMSVPPDDVQMLLRNSKKVQYE